MLLPKQVLEPFVREWDDQEASSSLDRVLA